MPPPAVPCPRCDFPVEYEQDGCPRCQEERRNKLFAVFRKLGGFIAVLLVLAAWQHRRIRTSWQEFMVEVEYARYPALRKQRAQAAEAEQTEAAKTAAAREAARIAASIVIFTTAPPRPAPFIPTAPDAPTKTGETETPAPRDHDSSPPITLSIANATAPPTPAPPTEHRRRFYGVVYDVATLKPVAGAKLLFRANTAQAGWPATTNELGHYQLDLVKGTIDMPMVVAVAPVAGYREGQLEDTDPPLRERPRSVRRRIIEETSDNDLEPVPLRFQRDADIVPLDLVLLPKHGKVTQ